MEKKQKNELPEPAEVILPLFEKLVQNRWIGLILGGILGVLILILSLAYHKVGNWEVETDFFGSYVPEARKFIQGEMVIDGFRGPLYPMILGIFGSVFGNYFLAGKILTALSAAAFVWISFEIVKGIFDSKIAFMVALFTTVNAAIIEFTYSVGTDLFFAVLLSACLYFLLRGKGLTWKNMVISALFGGLAVLTRYNGFFIPLFAILYLLLFAGKISEIKSRIVPLAIFLGVFMTVILPYGVYTQSEKGEFFYNRNFMNVAWTYYGLDHTEVHIDQWEVQNADVYHSLGDVIFKDFGYFLTNWGRNTFYNLWQSLGTLMGWPVGIFTILGIGMLLVIPMSPKLKGYLLFNLLFYLVLTLVWFGTRFYLFLVPGFSLLAILCVAYGVNMLTEKKAENSSKVGGILLSVVAIATLFFSAGYNKVKIVEGTEEILWMGEWVEENLEGQIEGAKVMARKPHVAYFMNMDFVRFPAVTDENVLIQRMKDAGVEYLYFGRAEAKFRPEFSYLQEAMAMGELVPIASQSFPAHALYKLKSIPKLD